MVKPWRIVTLLFLLTLQISACAFTTDTIKINYNIPEVKTIPLVDTPLKVETLKDARGAEPHLLSYKGVAYKTTGKYVSEKEVADIVTEALVVALKNIGCNITNERETIILNGEILKFDSNIHMGFWAGTAEAYIQLALKLIDAKTGQILWFETISGKGIKEGLQIDRSTHREDVLNQALSDALTNLTNSKNFISAIRKANTKTLSAQ